VCPPQQHLLGAVITGEDHQRVAREVQQVEQVEQCPEVGVEFEQAVGPVSVAGLALEFLPRDHRHVHQRMVEVDKERHALPGLGADERRGAPQVLPVAVAPDLKGELIPFGDVLGRECR
jgi:hypothetical protein